MLFFQLPLFKKSLVAARTFGENDDGNETGDGQEVESDLLNGPNQINGGDGAYNAEHGEDVLEVLRHSPAEDEIQAHKAEVPLTHQGGYAKEQ